MPAPPEMEAEPDMKPSKKDLVRSRAFWFLATVTCFSTASIAACSSSGDDSLAQDSGTDGTVGDGSGGDGSTKDGSASDGGGGDSGPVSCPAQTLSGTCDLVLQNCPSGNECVPILNADNSVTAQCQPAGTGAVPQGHECCPNAANQGGCVSGTFCLGNDCSVLDGGPGSKSGRCSPYCCQGDNGKCGSSDPEGLKGTCDTNIIGQNPQDGGDLQFGSGCTYKPPCKPFHVQSCGSDTNSTCTLQDDGVSFRCSGIFQPPGQDAGTLCNSANACANGLECLGPIDAGATCTIMCYRADGGTPPFDASVLTNAPGFGGCPVGSACNGTLVGGPGWYGFCVP